MDDPQANIVEVTYPPAPSDSSPAPTPPAQPVGPKGTKKLVPILAGLIVLVAGCGLSFAVGYQRGNARATVKAAAAPASMLQVPQGATIISQCAKGRGTQYVLPTDIPHGPVYNVSGGKVIGLEYMIGKDDLASEKNYINLPLFGKNYDHIDVGLLSQGHAGYPEPHYHVDVYDISRAASAAITCK